MTPQYDIFDSIEISQDELGQNESADTEIDIFDSVQLGDEQESFIQKIGRHGSRVGSRVGETLVGMPGDVVSFVEWLDSKMPETPKFLKREPNFVQKAGAKALRSLPKSHELKEMMSELTDGFTDPQGAVEEFGDSVIELGTALAVGKDPTKIKGLLKTLGKATVTKGAGKGVELLGVGEEGQLYTEMGTLFLMGLADKKMASKYLSDKYQKARELIPEGTMINTSSFVGELESMEAELSKGLSTASKAEVKEAVTELKNKVSGGALPVEEMVQVYHDINERMASRKLFTDLSKTERKKLKFRYDNLKSNVEKQIKNYGENNPKFYKEWTEANEGLSSLANSQKVSGYLESKLGSLPKKVAGGMAIELFLGFPGAAKLTGAAFSGLKTGEMLYRIGKSPTLRKYYLEVIKNANQENFPGMVKSLTQLENGLQESFFREDED